MSQTTATTTRKSSKIRFACEHCGDRLSVPAAYAGQRGKCHACKRVIQIPAASIQPERSRRAHPAVGAPLQLQPAPERSSHVAGWSDQAQAAKPTRQRQVPCVECGGLFPGDGMLCKECKRGKRTKRANLRPARDLAGEAHVRAIAFWQVLGGGLGTVGALLATALLLTRGVMGMAFAPMILVAALPAVLVFAIGYGLWRYHTWSRWLNVALSGLALLGTCVGLVSQFALPTLLGALINVLWHGSMIWVLVTKEHIFTPDYREAAHRSHRAVPFWSSPFFWIPAALILICVLAAIALIGSTIVIR
ncbi:MAG: hypothetical protein AB7N76_03035 [Planctomycetota bacterium]